MSQGDLLHVVTADDIGEGRRRMGKLLIWGSFAVMVAAFAYCALAQGGVAGLDLETWRPALYGYLVWATGLCIGHVAPEAAHGGPIALIAEGDRIRVDLPARRIDVLVDEPTLEERRDVWQPHPARYTTGALAKYAALVGSAERGAVCD